MHQRVRRVHTCINPLLCVMSFQHSTLNVYQRVSVSGQTRRVTRDILFTCSDIFTFLPPSLFRSRARDLDLRTDRVLECDRRRVELMQGCLDLRFGSQLNSGVEGEVCMGIEAGPEDDIGHDVIGINVYQITFWNTFAVGRFPARYARSDHSTLV